MNGNRIRRTSLAPTLNGDEIAHNTEAFHNEHSGQTQISDPDMTWTLHLVGDPDQFRHLASLIFDAANDLEAQIHEQVLAHYGPMAQQLARMNACTDGAA